jgi:hypothetical protein
MKYEDLLEYLLKLREKEQSVTDEEKKQRVFTEKQFEVLNKQSNLLNSVMVQQNLSKNFDSFMKASIQNNSIERNT